MVWQIPGPGDELTEHQEFAKSLEPPGAIPGGFFYCYLIGACPLSWDGAQSAPYVVGTGTLILFRGLRCGDRYPNFV